MHVHCAINSISYSRSFGCRYGVWIQYWSIHLAWCWYIDRSFADLCAGFDGRHPKFDAGRLSHASCFGKYPLLPLRRISWSLTRSSMDWRLRLHTLWGLCSMALRIIVWPTTSEETYLRTLKSMLSELVALSYSLSDGRCIPCSCGSLKHACVSFTHDWRRH